MDDENWDLMEAKKDKYKSNRLNERVDDQREVTISLEEYRDLVTAQAESDAMRDQLMQLKIRLKDAEDEALENRVSLMIERRESGRKDEHLLKDWNLSWDEDSKTYQSVNKEVES